MRSNRKILFGLSLIVGAFLFWRAFKFLSGLGRSAGPVAAQGAGSNSNLQTVSTKTSLGRIAYAAVDIPANSIVTPDMLAMRSYDGPSAKGFITDIESQGAGFITRRDIPAGSQLRPDIDFVGHVSETGIAGLLRPGMRAMVVPIANKPTLHDLVRIGNFVDILAAFDAQESRTLVQNVRVLGVDVSANDYPNVNAAMRGPFKAAPKGNAPSESAGAGGASAPASQPNGAGPAATPASTPIPANAPRPDPALILEVSPRQAAAIQLALASNAPLDFLVRPALPANRSGEPGPLDGTQGGTMTTASPGNGTATVSAETVSVTKPQIAPYAESRKNAGGGKSGNSRAASGSGDNAPLLRRGGRRPLEVATPDFPTQSASVPPLPVIGSSPSSGRSLGESSPSVAPPPQTYSIPVYGDGKILRTEVVPLPSQ